MRKTVLLLASMAVALVVACGAVLAATPKGTTAGTDQGALEGAKGRDAALDGALKELVARHGGPPGVIAVIQRGQHREVHTFGVANLKNNRPMGVEDHMRLASTSKAFSGAVALSLVSKGALSLNNTIGELLSDLPKPPPDAWADVTLRQLLNHTSGLPDFAESQAWQAAINARPTQAPRPEKLLTYAYDHKPPLRFDPGSKYQYSNSDNIAAALMIEAATGRSYEGQLRRQVYEPLGLSKTSLPAGPNLRKPYIHGYDLSEHPPEDGSEEIAAGCFGPPEAWFPRPPTSTPSSALT